MKSKMKDIPEDQQEKMMKMLTENPDLFRKLGEEIKAEMAKGKDQMAASIEVAKRHEKELKNLI